MNYYKIHPELDPVPKMSLLEFLVETFKDNMANIFYLLGSLFFLIGTLIKILRYE
jgi:hypothetical protein